MGVCGRQNNALPPKDVHILIPITCEYVTSHRKRDFVGMIESRILRRGGYILNHLDGLHIITRAL